MNFTPEHNQIRETVQKLCQKYGDDYWLKLDHDGDFPEAFVRDLTNNGWLGIALPIKYGGSGLGIFEAAILLQTIAESGACFSGASAIHLNIFGPNPIAKHGTAEQKERMLKPLIKGTDRMCFAVTESNAGLDTTRIETTAERSGNQYIVSGHKIWTSGAQKASKIMLLTRTTPIERCVKPTDGMSLFFTDFNRNYIDTHIIDKMGRKAVDSNSVFIDGLPVPKDDLIGEEGNGFHYLLDGLNPERILIAAEAIGIGRVAIRRASDYACERIVFGRPIGSNQAIQHPLASSWCELEAANLMTFRAAELYDKNLPCAAEANAAKYLSAEGAFRACERAVMTHGGMGYSKEFHVERYMREIFIARIAPVSREMILNYISERKLGLPRSY